MSLQQLQKRGFLIEQRIGRQDEGELLVHHGIHQVSREWVDAAMARRVERTQLHSRCLASQQIETRLVHHPHRATGRGHTRHQLLASRPHGGCREVLARVVTGQEELADDQDQHQAPQGDSEQRGLGTRQFGSARSRGPGQGRCQA